jgi:hypothetical protein
MGLRAGLDTRGYRKNPFTSAGHQTSIALYSSPSPDTILTELPGSLNNPLENEITFRSLGVYPRFHSSSKFHFRTESLVVI